MLWMVGPTFNLAIVSTQNTIGFTVYYKIYTMSTMIRFERNFFIHTCACTLLIYDFHLCGIKNEEKVLSNSAYAFLLTVVK